jgi:hypothetical protein
MPSKDAPKEASEEIVRRDLKTSSIRLETFNDILTKYPEQIPAKLDTLEKFRMQELPSALQQRITSKKHKGDIHLTKDELVRLVEWKLYDSFLTSPLSFNIDVI